jgi:hypothetical protein
MEANALLPGISTSETLASNYPPAHVRDANMTVEQPLKDGSVFGSGAVAMRYEPRK